MHNFTKVSKPVYAYLRQKGYPKFHPKPNVSDWISNLCLIQWQWLFQLQKEKLSLSFLKKIVRVFDFEPEVDLFA